MTLTLAEELDRILSEPIASVVDREEKALDRLLEDCGRRVVLFGAGGLGRQTLTCLRTIGIEPLAISDSNPQLWGTRVDDIPVVAPHDAASRFGSHALFIVTIWNPFHWYSETRRRLQDLGCQRITSASPLYWRFADTFLPFYSQDLPHKVYENRASVLAAAGLWADERSRQEYLQQISWRACGLWSFTRPSDRESYFLDELFSLIPEEVFIDCGAFDGDTLRTFLSRTNGHFRHCVAIEPDSITFATLEAFVARLPREVRQKISLLHCAVGAERAMIPFQASGQLSSKSSHDGHSEVLALPISELPDLVRPVTFIKMDVEGAESDALWGARATIERDTPVLAICVYHTQADLWNLPLLMKEMCPDSDMHLRCHEGDGWQTVAYAVPPERALTASRRR